MKLALIDDDKSFLQLMSLALSDDFTVCTYNNPEEAVQSIRWSPPDAVLLDLCMNEVDGFEVCEKIKQIKENLPVFFLTSDQEVLNISRGFEIGGLDYFSKQMPPQEIITRLKCRMKSNPSKNFNSNKLKCRDITIDTSSMRVWVKDTELNFSPKEFEILKCFMEHQDQILSKPRILDLLWKDVFVNTNNIDTHMFHIRKKFLGHTTGIECKKSVGYIQRSDVSIG